MTTKHDVSEELLKSQIEGYTNFERELAQGGAVKTVMAGTKSRDLYQVNPDILVVIEGFNPRTQNADYFAGIEALAENMIAHGFMQDKPVSGYITRIDGKDVIAVNDGHRRLAAVKIARERGAQIKTIPLVLKERGDNMVDLTLSLLHSNEGQPFTMYEKAVIAKRLKRYGWENKEIAKEMHCTAAFVGELLNLAGAPDAIQSMVRDGLMSGTRAVEMVKVHGADVVKVAQQSLNAAKAKGKNKTTAKDAPTPVEAKTKNAKKVAYELYRVLRKVLDTEGIAKRLDDKTFNDAEKVCAVVEKERKVRVPREPKAAKAPKAAKPKAAAKVAPIKTKGAKKAAENGAEFFNRLNKEQAERKASANGTRRVRGYSERRA